MGGPPVTGPEHYAEAERLLALASEDLTNPLSPAWTHLAQIHAQLALTAAVATDRLSFREAETGRTESYLVDGQSWREAIS
jgi:hypothetical protein